MQRSTGLPAMGGLALAGLLPGSAAASPFFDAVVPHLPLMVKAGSLGFAFLAAILAFVLIHGRRAGGHAYLGMTLAAAFVFLVAENYPFGTEIRVVRYPKRIDADIPLPIVSYNRRDLFVDGGSERLACDPSADLTIDAEGLIEALKEARRNELQVAAAPRTAAEALTVGFDGDAGGQP